MSDLRYLTGVGAFQLVALGVGFALLSAFLREARLTTRLSYAGVALLTGTGALGVVTVVSSVAGVVVSVRTFLVLAGGLAALGVIAARLSHPVQPPEAHEQSTSPRLGLIAFTAGAVLVATCSLMLYAGFRSAPWLDDTWDSWLPKGVVLERIGLDERVFAGGAEFVSVNHPAYPLWWPVTIGQVTGFIGNVNTAAVTFESAILLVALVAAAARLLHGRVRPWLLWPALLLLLLPPMSLSLVQSGGADMATAVFLVAFGLAGARWLADGHPLDLAVAGIAGATAANTKFEGALQLILASALATIAAGALGVPRRRTLLLGVVALAAFGSLLPWLAWTQSHGIADRTADPLSAVNPFFLADQAERVRPAAEELAASLFTRPASWLLLLTVALVLAAVLAFVTRRAGWLAVVGAAGVYWAFWTWVFWADTDELSVRIGAAPRVVAPAMLAAAVAIPVLLEGLVRAREASHEGAAS